MHKKETFVFETKEAAQAEVDSYANVRYTAPNADYYVRGPFFNDGINSVTGEQWQEPHWSVTVEKYW